MGCSVWLASAPLSQRLLCEHPVPMRATRSLSGVVRAAFPEEKGTISNVPRAGFGSAQPAGDGLLGVAGFGSAQPAVALRAPRSHASNSFPERSRRERHRTRPELASAPLSQRVMGCSVWLASAPLSQRCDGLLGVAGFDSAQPAVALRATRSLSGVEGNVP